MGTEIWKKDHAVASHVDCLLANAMASGIVAASSFGVLEVEDNDFYANVIRLRKGEVLTVADFKSGPYREQFYKACSKIGQNTVNPFSIFVLLSHNCAVIISEAYAVRAKFTSFLFIRGEA